jgi:MoaA/NifB/PqqE/SkfB family radical SAM enzyme
MRTLTDYLHQKASVRKIPINGTFELSPVCNFACKMCYVRKTPEQIRKEGKSLIPWQRWLELAEQCRAAGTLYLLLTGGEPFLYPGFRELYTHLHKMGFLLYINSNGTMIDAETVAWLKQAAPCRVNITLYGASPETYQRICGHADGYHRAMNAIRMLRQANIPVVINASMIPENAEDMEAIMQTGRELGLNTRVATYMFPPMRRDTEKMDSRFSPAESAAMYLRKMKCLYSAEKYCDFLREQTEHTCYEEKDGDDWGRDAEYMRCRAGRSSFWVNWEGVMTACGMLDFPLKTEPLRENFHDCWMRLTEAVRTTPVLGGCAGCEKRELCSPCVAMIYGETGTVDEKAQYMCQMSDRILELMKNELEELQYEREPRQEEISK